MVTTHPPKTIVKPTALGPVANTDTKLLIYGLFQRAEFWHRRGRNLTDQFDVFLRGERFLVVDRDKKFTTEFRDLLEHAGTDVIWLLHRSPNLNAYVERFVLSIKSECLERMIFFSEPSLRRAVAEFIHHYHGERNRQGLGNALLEAEECVGKANQNEANEGAHHCNSLYNTLSGVPRAAGVRPAPRPRAKPGTERFRLECKPSVSGDTIAPLDLNRRDFRGIIHASGQGLRPRVQIGARLQRVRRQRRYLLGREKRSR